VRPAAALIVAAAVMAAAPAAGQTPSRPGPWVLDIRGVTSAVPTDTTFYPALTSTVVPSRGFGADVGAHVYLFNLGPARVGLGAGLLAVRATASASNTQAEAGETAEPVQRVAMTLRAIAPQLSLNFGSGDGWSYLSAGVGVGSVHSRTENSLPGERESGRLRMLNYGGGARWFISPRLAFGHDLRAYQLAAGAPTPRVSIFAAGAGLSFRK
jgi:hypothetical protein